MRIRSALAALAVLALIAAGCGGDDDPTSDDRPDIEDSETPTTAVVAEGTSAAVPTPTAIEVVIEPARLTYTVEQGDLLGSIANTFGVPLGALIDVNELENPDVIQIGQEIIIPTQEEVDAWNAAQAAAEPETDDTADDTADG